MNGPDPVASRFLSCFAVRDNLGDMSTKNSQAADDRRFAQALPADHLTGTELAGTFYSSRYAEILRSDWYRHHRMMFTGKI